MTILFILIFSFSNLLAVTYSTNTTMTADEKLSLASNVASVTGNATIDGDGAFNWICPVRADVVIDVGDTFTATTEDMIIEHLLPGHITLNTSGDLIFGTGTVVELGKSSTLDIAWKFTDSELNGRGFTLTLDSSGVLEAQAGASMTLKNMTIAGVDSTNIRCADNDATIIFDNVKLITAASWSFDTGAFSVQNKLKICGGGIFSYESAYASTILSNSKLVLSDNLTFSYDPVVGVSQAVAGQKNLILEDDSSKLICDGVTLKITNTGMQLDAGVLRIKNKCILESDAHDDDYDHGFIWGDGEQFDVNVEIYPGSSLEVIDGVLNYQNEPPLPLNFLEQVTFQNVGNGHYLFNDSSTIAATPTVMSTYWLDRSGPFNFVLTAGMLIRFTNASNAIGFAPSDFGVLGQAPPISSPTPPYFRMRVQPTGTLSFFGFIHKNDATTGEIFSGDEIIFAQSTDSGRNGGYFSSSAFDIAAGQKEVYTFKQSWTMPTGPGDRAPGDEDTWVIRRA